jgi:signal transduction histidine kinase
MRERVALAGGELEVSSGPNGSAIRAEMKSQRLGQPG